ncbi:MAG TPA: c-type cytochrome biogenesis protein CcmI [Burkholderiales bacterium]|nr:c-type cytochrome biogenesis protein CcmI [Burkholderiales bacterium]
MILFALGALALVAATLGFLLWPLARAPHASATADTAATNAAVLRDQLAELERDHSAGTIAGPEYEQAKLELKRRLLEDTAVAESAPSAARRRPIAAVATAIALPVTAAGLYFLLGTPGALDPEQTQPQLGRADIEAMVDRLAQRLQNQPDDAEGWAMLGRSYRVLGRNEEAAQAYAKAEKVVANDSRLLVDYAESLALVHGGNLEGKPAQLVARALELDPENPLGLMLSGAVAFQREDYAGAIRQWEKVQSRLEPGSEEAHAVGASIAKARELAAAAPPATAPAAKAPAAKAVATAAKVAGTVRLAAELASKAAPTDTVFVFARATGGPGPPLAVLRRQVKDLPLEFSLDDTMAMASDRKLSGATEVVVGARISRSGNPMPQSGDLQGVSKPVKVGATGVAVVIGAAVP